METESYFLLGRLVKPHGLRGEIKAIFDVQNPEPYARLKKVWVEMDGVKIPKKIKSLRHIGALNFILSLHDHPDIDSVESLSGLSLYLPDSYLPPLREGEFYYHEIIGFTVVDVALGEIGEVREVLQMPAQDVIVILHNGHEVLLPVIDEFITGIDRDERKLHIAMPDGLLDVYLE